MTIIESLTLAFKSNEKLSISIDNYSYPFHACLIVTLDEHFINFIIPTCDGEKESLKLYVFKLEKVIGVGLKIATIKSEFNDDDNYSTLP
jgi:hypothetical protein